MLCDPWTDCMMEFLCSIPDRVVFIVYFLQIQWRIWGLLQLNLMNQTHETIGSRMGEKGPGDESTHEQTKKHSYNYVYYSESIFQFLHLSRMGRDQHSQKSSYVNGFLVQNKVINWELGVWDV